MSEKDAIIFPGKGMVEAANKASRTRTRSFKIRTSPPNLKQFVAAVNAYALAGMPFEHIANAGDFLGDEVERKEIDAPLQQEWKNKVGEVVEYEKQVMAWQARGETASTTPELPSPQPITHQEVVVISKDLTTIEPTQDQTVRVIEGINVSLKQDSPSVLPNSTSHDQALENNPYLQPIAGNLKKAA